MVHGVNNPSDRLCRFCARRERKESSSIYPSTPNPRRSGDQEMVCSQCCFRWPAPDETSYSEFPSFRIPRNSRVEWRHLGPEFTGSFPVTCYFIPTFLVHPSMHASIHPSTNASTLRWGSVAIFPTLFALCLWETTLLSSKYSLMHDDWDYTRYPN